MITKGIQAGAATALELLGRSAKVRPGEAAGPAAPSQRVDNDGLRRLSALVRAFEAAAGRAPARASDAFRTRLEQTMTDAAGQVRALSGSNAAAPMVAVVEGDGEATLNGAAMTRLTTPPTQRLGEGSDRRDRLALDAEGRVRGGNTSAGDDRVMLSAETAGRIGGGAGDDNLTVAARSVRAVEGGAGDDRLKVAAETVGTVHGGSGDDLLRIDAISVGSVLGGGGDDSIEVDAIDAALIAGGKGDDRIAVRAMAATVEGGAGDDDVLLDVSDAALRFGVGDGSDTVRLGRGTHLALDFGPGLTRENLTVETVEDAVVLRFAGGESVRLERLDRSGSVLLRFDGGETVALHGEPPSGPEAGLDARV
jgi:hypothetical protein